MTEAADRRDTFLLAVACMMGGGAAALIPMVGLPLMAAGTAGLTYGGRIAVAAGAVAVGTLVAILLRPVDGVFVVPAALAVFVTVFLLLRRPFQAVVAGLVVVLFASALALDAVSALAAGTTLSRSLEAQAVQASRALAPTFGPELGSEQVELMTDTALSLWPSAYFQTSLFTAILVVAGIAWAARRTGRSLSVPPFSQLDISIHVVWALIAGLVLLAAASLMGDRSALFAAGLNLVAGVRALLLVQGLAVASSYMERTRLSSFVRLVALGLLIALDTLFFVVSLVGLVDMWANFRRLPRGGASERGASDDTQPDETGM